VSIITRWLYALLFPRHPLAEVTRPAIISFPFGDVARNFIVDKRLPKLVNIPFVIVSGIRFAKDKFHVLQQLFDRIHQCFICWARHEL
jgi:hypothetical protein